MFQKFLNWLKSLFGNSKNQDVQSEPVVLIKDHKFNNFLSAPVMSISEGQYPVVGIVSELTLLNDQPAIKFMDYVSGQTTELNENFTLFSNSALKTALSVQDKFPVTFEEVENILTGRGFYKAADMYFLTVKSTDT